MRHIQSHHGAMNRLPLAHRESRLVLKRVRLVGAIVVSAKRLREVKISARRKSGRAWESARESTMLGKSAAACRARSREFVTKQVSMTRRGAVGIDSRIVVVDGQPIPQAKAQFVEAAGGNPGNRPPRS